MAFEQGRYVGGIRPWSDAPEICNRDPASGGNYVAS
jgi:hypothetical protein